MTEPAGAPPRVLAGLGGEAVLERLGDAVVVADRHGIVVFVNAAAERLLAWRREELVGSALATIIPERFRQEHQAGFTRFLSTGEARLIGGPATRLAALRRDGTEVRVELTVSAHDVDGREQVVIASLRDATVVVALERERAVNRYLALTNDLTAGLALRDDMTSLGQAAPMLLDTLARRLGWAVGGVWEMDGDGLRPVGRWASAPSFEAVVDAGLRFRAGEGIPGRVVVTRSPLWVPELAAEAGLPRAELFARLGLRSGFGFPVMAGREAAGAIELYSPESRPPEPELMAAMVSAAAEAWRIIERGRIRFEAAQARENLVRLARAFQASLLPPALPAIAGVELAASYQPAEGEGEVGGDFYDVFPLGGGVWGLTIGDVCGRGPEAAALTSLARHTIRASATGRTDPGEVLTTLNDVVYEDLTRRERWGDFLSAVYLTFEVVDGGVDLDVANAGHPPPMVVRASGEVVELNEPGQVLGVTASAPTARAAARLAPGDALVLVTDGVTEAHIPGQAQFGETRMAAVLSDVAGQPPATIVAALVDAVRAHTEGQAGRDDVAMVCLSPLSAGWPRRPR